MISWRGAVAAMMKYGQADCLARPRMSGNVLAPAAANTKKNLLVFE